MPGSGSHWPRPVMSPWPGLAPSEHGNITSRAQALPRYCCAGHETTATGKREKQPSQAESRRIIGAKMYHQLEQVHVL